MSTETNTPNPMPTVWQQRSRRLSRITAALAALSWLGLATSHLVGAAGVWQAALLVAALVFTVSFAVTAALSAKRRPSRAATVALTTPFVALGASTPALMHFDQAPVVVGVLGAALVAGMAWWVTTAQGRTRQAM